MKFTVRSAASKGPFDVVSVDNDVWEPVAFYQLTRRTLSCKAASKLMLNLWNRLGMPSAYGIFVVHRTKDREFCEH
jgi:hypothetical protein